MKLDLLNRDMQCEASLIPAPQLNDRADIGLE